MKSVIVFLLLISGVLETHALVISEVMSNPTGDDSGREWIELYNDTAEAVDLALLTVSIKGATAIPVTPVSGGTALPTGGYAIIGSVVSSATKFLLDYPAYTGPLLRSSMSLVNTGTTSIDIKLQGSTVNSLPGYTPAKEGFTVSLVGGTFILSSPTPGAENQASGSQSGPGSTPQATTTENQVTVSQMSPPSADIILYMPFEKTVVAGADADFATYGMTRGGKSIDGLRCVWAFGDGGQAIGATTTYRYAYPGRYTAQVEATNSYVAGVGRMAVHVVPPDIFITNIRTGKYGPYVDISNPNEYSLDLSQWKLIIDAASFPFPKNTVIAGNTTTHFSGLAMGFASTTIATSSLVKILFPNLEEVTRYIPQAQSLVTVSTSSTSSFSLPSKIKTKVAARTPSVQIPLVATTTQIQIQKGSTTTIRNLPQKDTRIVAWFRSLLKN